VSALAERDERLPTMPDIHHLPTELSSFVGRAAELAAIRDSVVAGGVLALVGPGGCGKTRLAIRTGRDQVKAWPGGVWSTCCATSTARRSITWSPLWRDCSVVETEESLPPVSAGWRSLQDDRAT
jgi:hypothetical protein